MFCFSYLLFHYLITNFNKKNNNKLWGLGFGVWGNATKEKNKK